MKDDAPRHRRAADLTGKQFGRLTVIGQRDHIRFPSGSWQYSWACRCACGNEAVVLGGNLRSGATISCGCALREAIVRHGQYESPEYIIWEGMLARCSNANRPRYDLYGGRGIGVCDRWRDFALFIQDMGKRPAPGMSIERIDGNKGYEPGNCKWATAAEQQRHRRRQRNNTSSINGVTWDKNRCKWIAWIKYAGKTRYLGSFDHIEAAASVRKAVQDALGFHSDHGAP